ncbi:hypothetical protein PMAYCL1PPCAC_07849, partial [Pristionchus mayeri]
FLIAKLFIGNEYNERIDSSTLNLLGDCEWRSSLSDCSKRAIGSAIVGVDEGCLLSVLLVDLHIGTVGVATSFEDESRGEGRSDAVESIENSENVRKGEDVDVVRIVNAHLGFARAGNCSTVGGGSKVSEKFSSEKTSDSLDANLVVVITSSSQQFDILVHELLRGSLGTRLVVSRHLDLLVGQFRDDCINQSRVDSGARGRPLSHHHGNESSLLDIEVGGEIEFSDDVFPCIRTCEKRNEEPVCLHILSEDGRDDGVVLRSSTKEGICEGSCTHEASIYGGRSNDDLIRKESLVNESTLHVS